MRIRTNVQMIVGTIVVCIFMMLWGKHSRAEGDTVSKKGLEKMQAARERGLAEAAQAK